MLARQVRETLRTPGLGWIFAATAFVPAGAVGMGAAVCHTLNISVLAPVLLRLWFLAAAALVGTLSAAYGAASIAGRGEAGVLDAMKRHGVSGAALLAGKCVATVVLGLALLVATLPALALVGAFGRVPSLDGGFALFGLGTIAVLGSSLGVALGARMGRLRAAIVTAASAMALVPLALVAYARLAGAAVVGADDWAAVVLFGRDAAARRLDLYVHLAAPPLLTALALLGLSRALATSAFLPSDADRSGPVRRWIPGALVLAVLAAAFAI